MDRVGFQNSVTGPDLGLLCGSLALVDEAAEYRPAPYPLPGEVRGRVIGLGRAELAAAMGSPSVVMALVLSQDRPQVPFAEDQHPAGDLRPGGEHQPFGISVGRRRRLHPIQMIGTGVSG
jgi:hypothetical protein